MATSENQQPTHEDQWVNAFAWLVDKLQFNQQLRANQAGMIGRMRDKVGQRDSDLAAVRAELVAAKAKRDAEEEHRRQQMLAPPVQPSPPPAPAGSKRGFR